MAPTVRPGNAAGEERKRGGSLESRELQNRTQIDSPVIEGCGGVSLGTLNQLNDINMVNNQQHYRYGLFASFICAIAILSRLLNLFFSCSMYSSFC